MKKFEFLKKLKKQLSYELPAKMVEKNIDYYREYIQNEAKNGKSEDQVIEELGDPGLIARTIIDAAQSGADGIPGSSDDIDYKEEIYGDSSPDDQNNDGNNQDGYNQQRGYNHPGTSGQVFDDDSYRNDDSGWNAAGDNPQGQWHFYSGGCFGFVLVFIIIFLLFSFIGSLIGALSPMLVPLCMVFLILWLLSRRE